MYVFRRWSNVQIALFNLEAVIQKSLCPISLEMNVSILSSSDLLSPTSQMNPFWRMIHDMYVNRIKETLQNNA